MSWNIPSLRSGADKVAVAGSFIGIFSLAAGWLSLKANRLAEGEHYNLVQATGWNLSLILLTLWLISLVLAFIGRGKKGYIGLSITANALLVASGALIITGASNLLEGAASFARVSLGGGFWLSMLAIYFVLFATYRGLKGHKLCQALSTLTGTTVIIALLVTGAFEQLSIMQEYTAQQARFNQEFWRHIFLVIVSLTGASLAGIFLGIWATRQRKAERTIFAITNITQNVPSLALFGLLIAPLSALSFQFPVLREFGIRGIGIAPAVIALFIYSLLPIVRNTYVGLKQIDNSIIEAGLGMGMSKSQIFRRIQIPLALPLTLEGVRISSVQAVGLAAVAALIGAGGLGWFIFQGLGQAAPDMILLGAIPVVIMAVLVDSLMRLAVKFSTPRGLKRND